MLATGNDTTHPPGVLIMNSLGPGGVAKIFDPNNRKASLLRRFSQFGTVGRNGDADFSYDGCNRIAGSRQARQSVHDLGVPAGGKLCRDDW